ncbi:MAG: transposase [Bacteroidetes bacterium]|nr:transposase [Bacteroidota bacterium]
MPYNPQLHQRKSIRLKGYDYAQAGLYFITICTQNRACLFGEIINGEMRLTTYGEIALAEWKKTEEIRENCCIHESIIMPDHIHGIIEITHKRGEEQEIGKFQSPSQTIGAIIRGFKIASIKKIKELIQKEEKSKGELQFALTELIKSLDFKIWQRNYYEHIIRDEQSLQRIRQYIINNPQNWNGDQLKI